MTAISPWLKWLFMKLSEYLDRQGRGAKAKFASQIGAHASDLSDWISGARPVPVHRCAVIEQETGGAVTRKDLRPSDWRAIWPELIPAPKKQATQGHKEAAHG